MLGGVDGRLASALDARLGFESTQESSERPPGQEGMPPCPTIAVPMANGDEVLRCIGAVSARGLARFVLIGPERGTRDRAKACGVLLDSVRFLRADDEVDACELAANLAAAGSVDVLMKGYVHTASFIRAVLNRDRGLLDEGRLLSHVAVLDPSAYHKLLVISDAAINIEPDVEQKLAIAVNAVTIARGLGIRRPKVAFVAPAEVPSPRIGSTLDAQEIRRRWETGDLPVQLLEAELGGPFGLDVAVSREAAATKGISSPVAGDADILLMPNLDSGNALYKALTHFAGAHVAGVVAGARVPIVLTSRSDSEANRYLSVLLALAGLRDRSSAVLRSGEQEPSHHAAK